MRGTEAGVVSQIDVVSPTDGPVSYIFALARLAFRCSLFLMPFIVQKRHLSKVQPANLMLPEPDMQRRRWPPTNLFPVVQV